MLNPQVQILLSTYFGEAYLADQIDSILNQSYKSWQLLIRDDGSTDGTIKIIERYCSKFPTQIVQIKTGIGGSSTQNFLTLLTFSDAPYIMFCDQDDIWENDKIKLSLSKLKEIEKDSPVALVFSDMKVVAENLDVQFESFMNHQKLNPNWVNNNYFVFTQSIAAGCTMIFTKSLKEKMRPINPSLFQHDHWLLINASNYGKVSYINNKTVLYRQHQQNSIGSHKINLAYFFNKSLSLKKIYRRWKYINSQFPESKIILLLLAKLKLNAYRLLKSI